MRAAGVRVVGLSLYTAVVAWCWWQLPATMPFVVPAAAVGALLHGVKGRPWAGVLAFAVLVVVLPLLLAPALGTGCSLRPDCLDRRPAVVSAPVRGDHRLAHATR